MAKEDLKIMRLVELGSQGPDVVAIKRMLSRARVGYPKQVKKQGRFNNRFGDKLNAAIKRFQKKNGLAVDGIVGYMTFKALLPFADAFDSKLLRDFATAEVGDWGILGRKSAFAGIDMGVDFLGAGPIPMFADGKIVRITRTNSGWPGEGGLIVVKCDRGPMSLHPIYVAEDIKIPTSHTVGKRLKKGDLLAEATGSHKAPGIEIGWAGPPPKFFATLWFNRNQKHYIHAFGATKEGSEFWQRLSAWMAKGM